MTKRLGPVQRMVACCVRRSTLCDCFCNAANHCGFKCADDRRVLLLWLECVLHLTIMGLSVIGLLGLFPSTLEMWPWAIYSTSVYDAAANETVMAGVRINVWGACLDWGDQTGCVPWGDIKESKVPYPHSMSCAKAATGVRVQVILAVATNVIRARNVRLRCKRSNDQYLKCWNVITCIMPLLLMGSGAIQFGWQCWSLVVKRGMEDGLGTDAVLGVGYLCFAWGVLVNIPCLLIQLSIPVPQHADSNLGARLTAGEEEAQTQRATGEDG